MLTWTSLPGGPATGTERQAKALWGTNTPLLKILDMGLARMQGADEERVSGSITQMGALMGTPDFMAPEQARDAHKADTRSDLYSLGCTLYIVLTGVAPFPGGTQMEKVIRHQSEVARPVEQLRPDIPQAVAAIIRRLMSKRPEDRYQAPGELARVLAPLVERS
jgi:serine/threonine protein kinase